MTNEIQKQQLTSDVLNRIREIVSSALLGVGLLLMISPLFLYWFIHGDADRYLWIIQGPPPFDQSGSAPFQLWTGVLLLAAGIIFVIISHIIRNRPFKKYFDPKTRKSSSKEIIKRK